MISDSMKETLMPLMLLVIMILSVVGIAYSSGTNSGNTPAPTGQAQESFTYNGFDFSYVTVNGQGRYETTVAGSPVRFQTRPQSIERFSIPSGFAGEALNASTVTVVAPATTTGEYEQHRFAAQQLANDLASRLPFRATRTTQEQPSCEASTSDVTILVTPSNSTSVIEQVESGCYQTSTTDQSIFIISDYLVYNYHGIL
jgi:hypothetical protein